jgi:pimeloyl-ACP methyl ester carboxylesterase
MHQSCGRVLAAASGQQRRLAAQHPDMCTAIHVCKATPVWCPYARRPASEPKRGRHPRAFCQKAPSAMTATAARAEIKYIRESEQRWSRLDLPAPGFDMQVCGDLHLKPSHIAAADATWNQSNAAETKATVNQDSKQPLEQSPSLIQRGQHRRPGPPSVASSPQHAHSCECTCTCITSPTVTKTRIDRCCQVTTWAYMVSGGSIAKIF